MSKNSILHAVVMSFIIAVSFYPRESMSTGFNFKFGTGFGLYVGNDEELDGGILGPLLPCIVGVGYAYNDNLAFQLEGQFWWDWKDGFWQQPGAFFGSAVGRYTFLPESELVRPFAIVGLGYGWVIFFNEKNQENDGSGMVQIQAGGGVIFPINNWLGIGVEARIRVGVPNNPDMVSPSLLCLLEIGQY
jgi:hypothetical protein